MRDERQTLKRAFSILIASLPLVSFIIPLAILYSLDPNSFEATWKGRTYYLFFVWLLSLELILNWDELRTKKIWGIRSARTIAFVAALSTPTVYVVVANFFGLNAAILGLAEQNGIRSPWLEVVPLSTEYLVFAGLFALIVMLGYGIKGLKNFAISTFFLGIIGGIYTIDNFYPQGTFTPFQIVVPTTATLASKVLNLMGYSTFLQRPVNGMPYLAAWNAKGAYAASIAWPCAGVESLLIYAVTILLFLRKFPISRIAKIIYFVIGATITYVINIMRIATIYVIGINNGYDSAMAFHNYYGQLYSIAWIVSYPLIIIGTRTLWINAKSWRMNKGSAPNPLAETKPPNKVTQTLS
jgi:thaumarchaeosortase